MRPHSWMRWIGRGLFLELWLPLRLQEAWPSTASLPAPLFLSIKWHEMTFSLMVSLDGWQTGWSCELVCTEEQFSRSRPVPTTCPESTWERSVAGRRGMKVEQSVVSLEAIFAFLPSPDTGSNEVSGLTCTCPQPLWGNRCYLFSWRQEGGGEVFLVLMWLWK